MDADRLVERLKAQEKAAGLCTADTDSAQKSASAPLGMRLNNPFNLRPFQSSGVLWRGQTGVDSGFCAFATLDDGLRAGFINLRNQSDLHGLVTVRSIITKYAPRADQNDTDAYIAAVCKDTGFGPDDWLHLHEPEVLDEFGRAVIKHEQGKLAIADEQIGRAVTAALG